MRASSRIFPILIFILVIGASLVLLVFPGYMYRILLWIVSFFQAGGLPFLFFVMIVQALAIPIPSEFILMCGGAAFGLLPGWLVGTIGSLVASSICFYISHKGGRPLALRFIGEDGIEFADNWFNRWGKWAVLLGRFAPVIPFDPISYGAGLTKMRFRSFIIPTGIGTLPRALIYVFLGAYFEGTLSELIDYYNMYHEVPPALGERLFMFNIILFMMVIAIGSLLVIYWVVTRRYATRKREGKPAAVP